jgi:predicted adenylyl cyclase CyaB
MGKVKNVEFKARVNEIESYERKLLTLNPEFKGLDHQVDTYFNVNHGRLKLREGNIENALIQYNRENLVGSKQSNVILYQHQPDPALKDILTLQFGIKKIVDKKRKIYFVDNVKFHFDEVQGLGTFIEVEAIDNAGDLTPEYLKSQCDYYRDFFELKDEDMMEGSYSDML